MERTIQCGECKESVRSRSEYCPSCGAGADPWEEVAKYDFERDVDLPLVFDVQVGSDNWHLWRSFCYAAWGHEVDSTNIENLMIDPRDLKYNIDHHYYKIDEDYTIHGPYMTKKEARNA